MEEESELEGEPEELQWRTDEMALAAYLMIELRAEPRLYWEMNSCFFVFTRTGVLLNLVEGFFSDEALIEPRKYNMAFSTLRKAMFKHPDAPHRRRAREEAS